MRGGSWARRGGGGTEVTVGRRLGAPTSLSDTRTSPTQARRLAQTLCFTQPSPHARFISRIEGSALCQDR